jgi:endonuclease/exonuclease/phosphatase (EEP) superfamily protein YafD
MLPQWLENRSQPYLTFAAATFVVQTLKFHIGLSCLACVIYAAVRRRWRLTVVAGMATMMAFAPSLWGSITRDDAPAPLGATMRVMSMNVMLTNRNADALLETIRHAEPDVLVLQEYTSTIDEPLRKALAADYPYQLRKPMENSDGWAVFSRRPLVAPIDTALRVGDSERQARFAVRMGATDVIVYALHLTCPKSIEQIGANRAEVADLANRIASEGKPVILAGDFNFTDGTANAEALGGVGLRDAHDLAGSGRGSTWRYRALGFTHRLPGFRIDHIYMSDRLTCTSAQVLETSGSDHRPIIADVAWASQNPTDKAVASVE